MKKEDFTRYDVHDGGHIIDKKRNCAIKLFNSNGYFQCRLIDDNGKEHILGVHTVVAMFYCESYFEGCVVHHKDGDKHHNYSNNLECITRSQHSRMHVNPNNLRKYIAENGPANKGKKMSEEFRAKCRKSALKRGFNGNQYSKKIK